MPEPRANEVLVRIAAATVSSGDSRLRAMRLPPGLGAFGRLAFGLRRPRRPVFGMDLAGVVAAVGTGVTRFAVGDRVQLEGDLLAKHLKRLSAPYLTH